MQATDARCAHGIRGSGAILFAETCFCAGSTSMGVRASRKWLFPIAVDTLSAKTTSAGDLLTQQSREMAYS